MITLAGANTITSGGILVTNGTSSNLSDITGGTLTGLASGDLVVNQFNTSGGALEIDSQIVNNTSTALTLSGPGTLTLTNATNSYTGGTFVDGGTLNINAIGDISTGTLTLGGGTLNYTGSSTGTFTHNVVLQSNNSSILLNTSGGNLTLSTGVVSGSGGLILGSASTQTLTLSGTNTYTGGTFINGGALSVGTIADTGTSNIGDSGSAVFNRLTLGGGTLAYTGTATSITGRNVALTANSTIALNGASGSNLTFNGTASGSGGLTLTGAASARPDAQSPHQRGSDPGLDNRCHWRPSILHSTAGQQRNCFHLRHSPHRLELEHSLLHSCERDNHFRPDERH